MKKTKYLFAILFMLVAFLAIGATSVNAETVTVDDESAFLSKFSDSTSDVIQLNNNIDLSDKEKYAVYIYKDKTIDLKGNNLILQNYLFELWYYNNATVKFIDSSSGKTGKILGRTDADGSYPLINTYNDNPATYTETYLVFDGVKIEGNDIGNRKVVGPCRYDTYKISKVSFINTDITNFGFLNDGREANSFYYENITFKRGVSSRGYLISSSEISVSDVISDDSEIIEEYSDGSFKQKYSNDTKMNEVYTGGKVLKVRYIDGFTVSNVNLKETYGYTSATAKDISITNRGESNLNITNVSVDSANFIVSGPTTETNVSAGETNTSWKIQAKAGLETGNYNATITVTASNGKPYTSTVTLEVEEYDSEGNKVVLVTSPRELGDALNYTKAKTIKLANNLSFNTLWYGYVHGDTTIDLNGKTISTKTGYFCFEFKDAATITIIDSSSAKTGKIEDNDFGNTSSIVQITNNITDSSKECNLIIDGIKMVGRNTSNSMIVAAGNGEIKNVTLKNSTFNNSQYIIDKRQIEKITFENIKTTAAEYASRVYLVQNSGTLTVADVITSGAEVVLLEASGSDIRTIPSNELIYNFFVTNGQSIAVRYATGFDVSNVELNETYEYTDASVKDISIKNRGTSALQIDTVTVDSSNFIIVPGAQSNIYPGATYTDWKIKAKVGLAAGNYTATIKVTDVDNNTYTGTVKLTVAVKELTGLGIGGVDSTITYGTDYTPTLTGTTELGSGDYTIKYAQKDGETYKDLGSSKPTGIGEYKVTISITNENYKQIEVSTTYTIVPKEISPSVGYIAPEKYTGEEITPSITVFNGATMLTKDDDYTFEYANNTNAGKAKVIVKPVVGSHYTFTQFEKEFDILPKSITAESISVTLENTSYRYTGSEIKPEPVVKDGEKLLVKDTDYELYYNNNTNICDNTAEVYVEGIGNYENGVTKCFSIIAKEPQTISFDETSVTKTYGDSSFTIKANHTQGNGTVKYTSSDTNVAEVNETTGLVTINKAGTTEIKATASETADYGEETATYTLTVEKKEISINRASAKSKEYDGTKTAEVDYIIFNGLVYGEDLEKDVDYTATAEFDSAGIGYSKPVTVKVVLKDTAKANNYSLPNAEIQTRTTIRGKAIKEAWVTVDTSITYTYNGSNIEPVVTVKDPTGETVLTLTKGTHYTVVYSDNKNAGTGKIKVTGIGNYSGEIEKEFTINKKSITPTIEDIPAVTYNGSAHTPNLVVKDGSTTLIKGTDYTVEYTNNLRPGNGYAQISEVASSNYTFTSIGKDFTINKYEIKASDVTLEYTSIVFDNNAKKPGVTVKMGNEVIPPIEYNVDYSNNTNIGTATVKVTIKTDSDDFTGEVIKNFEIVNKTLLTISGINNQQVVYTGSPVVLAGNLTVSNGINPSDLTVKWYKEGTVISKPTNVGVYKVVYSYEDADYIGSLTVDFEITKKESSAPTLNTYKAVVGDKLSSITLPAGFKWVDENETIVAGNKEYSATYTTNNDTTNYTTKNINVKVYGKSKVNLTTSVNNGTGGTISASKTDILEGTTQTITFTPAEGFEINKVEVNGVDKTNSVRNNKLDVVMGNNDVSVVVIYKAIQYTITVKDVENVSVVPNGIIKVDYNSDKTFTIIAKHGYHLVSVKVNGVEKMSEMVYEELTLKNIKADAEIVIIAERNTYKVIEGANQKYIIGESNEAKFKIDAEYILFERGGSVYVDNELVDSSNYTSESGSTIIALKKEFVDKLSIGEHTLKVLFNDGEANTTFTVEKVAEQGKAPEQEKDNSLNPKTGDNIIVYVAIASISVFGILTTVVLKRKKKTN